jgi:hypothetical protein
MVLMLVITLPAIGQNSLEFRGQLSAYGAYNPDSDLDVLLGGRYIPELTYSHGLRNNNSLDFMASANIYGSLLTRPFDANTADGDVQPYRIWARYTGGQYEIRAGLQKINFGSAAVLRPLQWFDEIDPRDPLQLTNGVYALLGRYYFMNNANVWLWMLYGNEKTRGFEAVPSNENVPEFGGRFQYPVPAGEVALSYHHRTADTRDVTGLPAYKKVPENRIGLDGKWDVEVGLWFEAVYVGKTKDVGQLTHQHYLTLGTDYTFGVGNGLNVVAEHMLASFDENAFAFDGVVTNISAATIMYPLTLNDNISSVFYFSWEEEAFSAFVSYEHQFRRLVGYVMAYYNAETNEQLQQNELLYNLTGPGLRLMVVFNH